MTLFVGWFAGALVAEWLVAAPPSDGRRTASLRARALGDYLPLRVRILPIAMWAVLGLADLGGLIYLIAEHASSLSRFLAWIALDAIVAGILVVVVRRVVTRPQRGAHADLIETDDAIRSRSLHVIAGSTLAIGGYLLAGTVQALTPYSGALSDGGASAVQVVCGLLVPVLGYMTATGVHSADPPASGPARPRPSS